MTYFSKPQIRHFTKFAGTDPLHLLHLQGLVDEIIIFDISVQILIVFDHQILH